MIMVLIFMVEEHDRDVNVDDRVVLRVVRVDERTSSSVVKSWAWRMISWSCSHKMSRRRATAQCQILA